jgi:5-deoxy-glucuronate isomerase
LLIRSSISEAEYQRITPGEANWELLHFAARRIRAGDMWEHTTGSHEYGIVILSGTCSVISNKGEWSSIGKRRSVFEGMPYTIYLPRDCSFSIRSESDELDIAYGWCVTDEDHPAQLIEPADVSIEIRGGANATRQINSMIPPGFDCHRLVCVEVYTPSGNWSSYPPHKHDQHRTSDSGELLEADLEEIYFYKVDPPEGYAIQRVYTSDRRLDEVMIARNNELVLVPEGYHPVVSAHGYNSYYLNFLAGSAQSLANVDDPEHTWVKQSWIEKDPRLPMVTLDMK